VYLRGRTPIMINSNYYGLVGFKKDQHNKIIYCRTLSATAHRTNSRHALQTQHMLHYCSNVKLITRRFRRYVGGLVNNCKGRFRSNARILFPDLHIFL
jgi:hypothetical protein